MSLLDHIQTLSQSPRASRGLSSPSSFFIVGKSVFIPVFSMKSSFRLCFRFVCVWLLAAVGCGNLDDQSFKGFHFNTGMGPYKDMGGLEMCIGPHRIGLPDSEMGGFCVPAGSSASLQLCSTDIDCNTREKCVCGRCIVKFCTRNDECGEGFSCDFTANRCVRQCDDVCDCSGPNARCDIGMCQQMCLVNAECQTGEICSLSRARCLTVPCADKSDCFPDEECIIQREPRYVSGPSVVSQSGPLRLWVDMDVFGQRMVFGAQSFDPKRFDFKAKAALEPERCRQDQDCEEYRNPSVVALGSQFVMFFEKGIIHFDSADEQVCGDGVCEVSGERNESHIGVCPEDCGTEGIFRAVSEDGFEWIIDPEEPVLTNYYIWESEGLFSPSAVVHPETGELYLYYEAGRGDGIGVVKAVDALSGVFPDPSQDSPGERCGVRCQVLRPQDVSTPILWRDVGSVGTPMVAIEKEASGGWLFRMWFSAWGYESPEATSFGTVEQIPANYSIGYAGSPDGFLWEVWPFNPVFDRIYPNTFVNHASEISPYVIRFGTDYYMYYGGADREGVTWENLGLAINSPPILGD